MNQVDPNDLEACVVEATYGLFEQVIDTPIERIAPRKVTGPGFKGLVQVPTSPPMTVHVQMPTPLARMAAAKVFNRPDGAISDEDCSDLIGEMTNIVAGSLNGMFADATGLSLPTTHQTDHPVPDGVHQLWFCNQDHAFAVWWDVVPQMN
ncbi:MAG: chemotaxis protein CheX [Myxococcota bacterium]